MKLIRQITLLIALTAAVSIVTAQTTPQGESPELKQSRELTAKVVKLYSEHKFVEALPLAKRVIELAELALGKNDSQLISPLINLGDLYVATSAFDNAKKAFERALAIAETNYGPEDLHLTRCLDELGYLSKNKGDHKKAAAFFSRSLAIKSKHLKPDDIEIARANLTLANEYLGTTDYAEAERYYQEAMRRYDQPGGAYKQELVLALRGCIAVLTLQNKRDEAAPIQARLETLLGEAGMTDAGVINGKAIRLVQPPYPAIARQSRASGQVRVRVVIDETGKVISAVAISGHPLLHKASIEAAVASKFAPALKDGIAIKVTGIIIYNFVIW